MHLYDCRVGTFVPQATSGQIADILRERFADRMEHYPSDSEVRSWRNSLGAFADAIHDGMDDAWIVLEYQLPLASSRVDCMVVGSDSAGKPHDVLVEFKQWDVCGLSDVPGTVKVMGTQHLHPCAQVRAYRQYLEDAHSMFSDGRMRASSCAYLHNVTWGRGSGFFEPRFKSLLDDSPAFTAEDVGALTEFVRERTAGGSSESMVSGILSGGYKPSKQLLKYVADAIEGNEAWRLLDEQLEVFNEIMSSVERARSSKERRVIIAAGGPGTGKSVIAIQVVGTAARAGCEVVHATGSKAFTTNLRGIVGRSEPFRYFFDICKTKSYKLELVVCDEAHRLRERSDTRFQVISDRPQHKDIIDAAQVSVFLLDQRQSVRTNEVGSVEAIRAYAEEQGLPVSYYDLTTQFRCAGSESYLRWVDHALGLSDAGSTAWKRNDEYDVRILDSPEEMEAALARRIDEGNSARMVAGFNWKWTDPNPDGSLVNDVWIGSWNRPWNRKPRDMWRQRSGSAEPPDRHPYTIWATQAEGFKQIGCIYSAQGFEFDYVGVIFGRDLQWVQSNGRWEPVLAFNQDVTFKRGLAQDPATAREKLQHIYRVLSTRGMKGTYFYFADSASRRHFEELLSE